MSEDAQTPADGQPPRYTRRRLLWSAVSGTLALSHLPSKRAAQPDPTLDDGQVDLQIFQLPDQHANSPEQSINRRLPRHLSPEADAAISRGLAWLASQQQADGGFGAPRSYARNVGICALSGLAFLPQGMEGQFRRHIEGCTNYLLAHAQPSGYIVEDHVVTHAPMYGHGFAVTYLSQVYGMDIRTELRNVLKRGISLILSLQDENGAWRYTPFPEDSDVSVTTCQMLALSSARQAGFSVPREAIVHSIDFLLRCQNPDGGFRYRLIDPPESLLPRSAAAVVALHAAGVHPGPALSRGRQYLANPLSLTAPPADTSHSAEYYYYGRYYMTYAAWQAGGKVWDDWFPIVRDELLQRQTRDGCWYDPTVGAEYATAMALLTLQFPIDTLPLYLL